jgi:hypothetical protein
MGVLKNGLKVGQKSEFIKDQKKTDGNQEDAGDFIEYSDKFGCPLHDVKDGMDEKKHDKKWNGKTGRVY